jgi:hypothetical protein
MDEDGYFPTFEKGELDNQYYVHWNGLRWGLMTPIQTSHDVRPYGMLGRQEYRLKISFEVCALPAEPKPKKPKRTYARAMGLRKPAADARVRVVVTQSREPQ